MSNGNSRPPSFVLTRLYRKKSEKGSTYFQGRLAGARVALLKSNDVGNDGEEVWNLVVSEAPAAKRDSDASQRPQEPERRQQAAARDWQRPSGDDEISF
jgi:hypothetical protein